MNISLIRNEKIVKNKRNATEKRKNEITKYYLPINKKLY